MDRRAYLKTLLAAGAAAAVPSLARAEVPTDPAVVRLHRYKRSISYWTVKDLDWDVLGSFLAAEGIEGVDLVKPEDWHHLKRHGLDCSMVSGAELNLVDGFVNPEFEQVLQDRYREMIPRAAKAGYKNVLCLSGNARGMSKEDGLKQAVKALRPLVQLAEEHGVVLQLELFNSLVDHPDCMADETLWGVKLAQELNSPSFKLLYDLYHMQIMEGNLMASIEAHNQWFGHYHVAGVPGRHEPWDDQEVNFPAVMAAIDRTGFEGYVTLEYVFSTEKLASMRHSFQKYIR